VNAAAADAFASIGDQGRARAMYSLAVDADPTAHQPEAHFGLARLFLDEKEFGAARQILRNASLNSAVEPVGPIMDYLKRSGGLEAGDELTDFELSPNQRAALNHAIFCEHVDAGRIPKALELADKDPDILDAEAHVKLRAAVKKAGAHELVEPWLERRVLQRPDERPQLALLLADWAGAELSSAQQTDSAVAHLQKAQDLDRSNWAITERLADLRVRRGEQKLAVKALNDFLSLATDPAEKEKARQMLARIPSS
jgi:tetratricopeptide (TPR) repeat protein